MSRSDRLADALVGGGHTPADVSGLSYSFEETLRDFGVEKEESIPESVDERLHRLWQRSLPPDARVVRRAHKGASHELELTYTPSGQGNWLGNATLTVALCLAAGLVFLLPRWLVSSDLLVQCRHAIGIGLGIAWALLLWPAFIGWMIAGICFIVLVWQPALRSGGRRGDELILRSTPHASK